MKLDSVEHPQTLSHVYNLLQMNEAAVAVPPAKRQRRNPRKESGDADESGSVDESKSVITSLSLLDDRASEEKEMIFFETNPSKKTKELADFYSNCNEVDEIDHSSRSRKSRDSSVGVEQQHKSAKTTKKGGGGGGGGGEVASGGGGNNRRLWVKERSNAWWDECNRPDFPDQDFKKAFRMGKETFDLICEELNSAIAKEDTTLRTAIPVRQRVAVCIWRLATGEPLRLVSKRFGLGISTCHKLVLEVCSAIKTVLMPKYLQWPEEETLRRIKNEFESVSGIPNVVGSMYTTHIPIIAPKISVAAYFNKRHTERNQKTSYSITLQGVVDPRGVFTDVCIGWPGSMPDDQVLEKSALYQRANNGLLKGVWIIGGSGYPLLDWVLVPYTQQNLTWTQHGFNEKVLEVQKVAKEAFAKMKGRWSCLQKRTEVKLLELPTVLGACCVLHNICEMRGEGMEDELKIEIVDDEMVPEVVVRSGSSMKARDAIAHNLLHHGLAGASSFL